MSALAPSGTAHFVAEIDRRAVDRSLGLCVVMFAILAAADLGVLMFIAGLDIGVGSALPFLPTLVFVMIMLTVYCYAWGATRAIEWPLQLSPAGLVFCTPRGRVEVPWEAVTGVSIDKRLFTQQLTVRLHPEAGPGSPGVVSTVPAGTWRILRRAGLRLSLRIVRTEPAELAAAIASLSGGRWQPQPAR